mmetsp:Transcript_12997/g.33864  ORF Transcript_12997/g.33864 Transcript_12997/m.33864 type:complete len:235 (-) Transcript_12997:82-786(-)
MRLLEAKLSIERDIHARALQQHEGSACAACRAHQTIDELRPHASATHRLVDNDVLNVRAHNSHPIARGGACKQHSSDANERRRLCIGIRSLKYERQPSTCRVHTRNVRSKILSRHVAHDGQLCKERQCAPCKVSRCHRPCNNIWVFFAQRGPQRAPPGDVWSCGGLNRSAHLTSFVYEALSLVGSQCIYWAGCNDLVATCCACTRHPIRQNIFEAPVGSIRVYINVFQMRHAAA